MRTTTFTLIFMFLVSVLMHSQSVTSSPAVGDVFLIGHASNAGYEHIQFPRANLIIKKGGIVNHKKLKGKKVEITSIREDKNGNPIARIKLASSKKFFNSHKYVTTSIKKAIENKELIRVTN